MACSELGGQPENLLLKEPNPGMAKSEIVTLSYINIWYHSYT